MPSVYEILLAEYETTWGLRRTGNKDKLRDLGVLLSALRPNSPWKCKSWKTSSAFNAQGIFRSPKHDMKRRRRQLVAWDSKRLIIGKDDQDADVIKRIKALQRLRVKVKSHGRDRTAAYLERLECCADNTLYIEGQDEGQPSIQAAVWFEQTRQDWQPQAWFVSGIDNPAEHPLLHPFFGIHQTASPDRGLRSLVFHPEPKYIASTLAEPASDTNFPILEGTHYYLPFKFGENLQAAVRCATPLVLISDLPDGHRWRSTPFDLQFADFEMSDCTLFVATSTVEEISFTTSYLFGLGPDKRSYYCELGSDNSTLRWNLYLQDPLQFDPPSVYDTDSELNAALAGKEDDFYRDADVAYPPLGNLEHYDGWLGGGAWRSGTNESALYNSLMDAQFLHLQFGIALPTLKTTDTALAFRGTPTTVGHDPNFSYQRCFFRVTVGQPYTDVLQRITHESQIRVTISGCLCEGYFEPGTLDPVLNVRPVNDYQISDFARSFEVKLPVFVWPPIDQLALYLNLTNMRWEMHISNGLDFERIESSGDSQ